MEINNNPKNESHSLTNSHQIPEKPLVVLQPSKRWIPLNLSELWNYRDLLYILTERDIKVRYKQTLLGALWAIIQPLFTMLIFTLFFGKLAGIASDGIPYPIFAYAGLLPWTFFSNSVTNSGNSLIANTNLITKVYFPRMIIPIATVGAGLVDFIIAFSLLVVLMFYYNIALTISILILPFFGGFNITSSDWHWYVDGGVERQISRYPPCSTISCTARIVCNANYLSS